MNDRSRPPERRVSAHIDPQVKRFTVGVQSRLVPGHIDRKASPLGLSYTYVDYLLHVEAGHLPARPCDAEALEDLERVLSERRQTHAA